MYTAYLLRTAFFMLLSALFLLLFQYKKIQQWGLYTAFLVLIALDLGGVARRYVGSGDFVDKRTMEYPFEETTADAGILRDKGYYRVYEPQVGINGAPTFIIRLGAITLLSLSVYKSFLTTRSPKAIWRCSIC